MGRKRQNLERLTFTPSLNVLEKVLQHRAIRQELGEVYYGRCVCNPVQQVGRASAFYPFPVDAPNPEGEAIFDLVHTNGGSV